ncbi:hypothetical protein FA13DRAFT_1790603 [Coprinellus micaceus]|uniref:Uncharacterized protein n=1 Tax=Coprinellus micaceus TaxID=71717 RepID=A0A4Y7TFK4_COPMI|nr:hypothetical protein FA13DRAFT_1790603 [Coprinellus micaceus]
MGKPVIKGDFKCGCTNPNCKLEEQVQRRADILGVSLQMVAFSLSLLKNTAGATPIAGLKELSGGLLAVVIAIQDKREVKGGLKHIIVDCLKVTCIVCQHARRRKHNISLVVETAISELNLELAKIKEQADKMNKRGWFMGFIMGSADKATVNALRQQLTTSWGLFSTELQMDTNYKVTKADKVGPAEVWKRMFDEMAAKHQIGRHAPAPPPNASARRHSGYDFHNQRQQAERDHTLRRSRDAITVCDQVLDNVDLSANIFRHLKELAYSDAGIPYDTLGTPSLPGTWTTLFARLATVNGSFFHASIGVLWEKMDSLYPFFYNILPADRYPDGTAYEPLAYAITNITSDHWKRFLLYSSQTRVLALNRPSGKEMSIGWLLHLSMCPTRPNPLFSKLDHIILTSSDGLSFLVAVSAAPYAKALTINMDAKSNEVHEEAATSLTSSVCLASQRLEHISLLAPTHHNLTCILGNIRQCATLTSENVAIRRGVQRYTDFGPILKGLSSLQNLTTLKIIDAPILCPEIMDRLLTIIPSIPSLRTVAVAPRRVTDLEEDALLLPDLDRLQEISR